MTAAGDGAGGAVEGDFHGDPNFLVSSGSVFLGGGGPEEIIPGKGKKISILAPG
jgi:hypothetical protein